ncbi:MAG: class A beta-lactamase-related serine hydrolase [Candidatus Omnitrophica bacterium]|nr:class A beta-lactamase-related serine hydrolase [Candidatus Omnitrophota bacterium]
MRRKIVIILGVFFILFFTVIIPAYSTLSTLQKKNKMYLNLKKLVRRELRTSVGGNAAFIIQDLASPSLKLSCREHERFPAASLIKLPILATAFRAVAEKRISLEEVVTVSRKDITGGSGILKGKILPVKLTFQDLLRIMIANSDNTATNKVINILGIDYINKTFRKLGLRDSSLRRKMMDFSGRRRGVENYTSASDIVFLLKQIYKNELVDAGASGLALSFLKQQKVNDRIPLYLPDEVDVAHKTGLERGVVHDAGIVYAPKGDYIVCVLTKKVKNYKTAKKFIAKLSLLTYNLYQ